VIWEEILETARILIVDDEPANVRLLERMLSRAGYRQVTGSTDSRQVVDLYEQVRPDLVLVDLNMPYVNGFEVVQRLRALVPEKEDLPILLLTAEIDEEKKQRALSLGATHFLAKPFNLPDALSQIRTILERRFLFKAQQESRT
jgi:two-component system sensor histidine kinase/response regulator